LGKIGAKSIHNLKGTLVSVYEFGKFEDLCDNNPCSLIPKKRLPSIGKQKRLIYPQQDALRLMSDDTVPEEWQVFYALQGLGGMRCGEAAGRRWRDLDWDAPVMPSLFVHTQYQDLALKTSKDDDHKDRMTPVHRELACILRRWWLSGWAKRFGRHPRLDDFICPNVGKGMKALTQSIVTKRPRKYDCPAVGIPNKGNHGFRRWLVTYGRKDGARKDMLERATHNACGEIIDVYTDPDGIWPAVCEAVACLKVSWPNDNVVRLPVAVGGVTDKLTDNAVLEAGKASENKREVVEAVGIEP